MVTSLPLPSPLTQCSLAASSSNIYLPGQLRTSTATTQPGRKFTHLLVRKRRSNLFISSSRRLREKRKNEPPSAGHYYESYWEVAVLLMMMVTTTTVRWLSLQFSDARRLQKWWGGRGGRRKFAIFFSFFFVHWKLDVALRMANFNYVALLLIHLRQLWWSSLKIACTFLVIWLDFCLYK